MRILAKKGLVAPGEGAVPQSRVLPHHRAKGVIRGRFGRIGRFLTRAAG